MEFRKQKTRNAELFLSEELSSWRLASVEEVRFNLPTIKDQQILDSRDICRLIDGFVDGPGYRCNIKNEYKENLYMGDMLLVKTPVDRSTHDTFVEGYAGVKLNSDVRKAALLLSCDDKITEVFCFVLRSIIEEFQDQGERQKELDRLSDCLKQTFSQRRTILHYAADQPINETHGLFIADCLLNNFEYGKELIIACDKYGRTALHFAALHGHIHLCRFLIHRYGLRADLKDRNGENLVHYFVNSNNCYGLKRLLGMEEVRNLIDSQDAKGKTPLRKAAANGNTDIMETLICVQEQNIEEYVRRADLFGNTALHEAASKGHHEAVKYLLKNGSSPLLERNSEGKTALHYSVQLAGKEAAIEMAEILLNHYRSGEEKLLLLWASATGIGTAEQSAELSPEVRSFLKQQSDRETSRNSASDLLGSAVKLKYDALALELINRGVNTSQIEDYSNRSLGKDERKRAKKCSQVPTEDGTIGMSERDANCSCCEGW